MASTRHSQATSDQPSDQLLFLVRGGGGTKLDLGVDDDDVDKSFEGVRCPLCGWRPKASDRWTCASHGAPEYFKDGCGTTWNTFQTKGRCPGCAHQWRWTSCMLCDEWSPHDDWYEHSEDET